MYTVLQIMTVSIALGRYDPLARFSITSESAALTSNTSAHQLWHHLRIAIRFARCTPNSSAEREFFLRLRSIQQSSYSWAEHIF